MTTSILTRKGQVTIPKEIRDSLKIDQGERVLFVQRGDEIVMKVLRGTILDLKDTVKPHSRPEDFTRIRESSKKALAARLAKHG